MKKILFGFGFLVLGCFFGAVDVQEISAQKIPVLEFFHGQECPHCQKEKAWFPELKKLYPNIEIKEYEVWHNPENKILMQKRLDELGATSTGVPTNIIGTDVLVGFSEEKILSLMEKYYGTPVKNVEGKDPVTGDIDKDNVQSIDSSFDFAEKKKLFFIIGGVVGFAIVGGFILFGNDKK